MFIVVIISAICKAASESEKNTPEISPSCCLYVAMLLSLVFGLGWMAGLLGLGTLSFDDVEVYGYFQYAFAGLVALHGLLTLALYCLVALKGCMSTSMGEKSFGDGDPTDQHIPLQMHEEEKAPPVEMAQTNW